MISTGEVGVTGARASCTARTGKNAGVRARTVDEEGRSIVGADVRSASRRASSCRQKRNVTGFRLFRRQYAWTVRSLSAWSATVRRQNYSLRGSLCLPRRVLMAISRRQGFAPGKCDQAMQDAVRHALTLLRGKDPLLSLSSIDDERRLTGCTTWDRP